MRGHGGPLGALRVNLDALNGPPHGPSAAFLGHFIFLMAFLKAFCRPLGQQIGQREEFIVRLLLSRVSFIRMKARRIVSMIRVLISTVWMWARSFVFLEGGLKA